MLALLGAFILCWWCVNLKTVLSHLFSVFSSEMWISMLPPGICLSQTICGKWKFPIF